MEAGFGVTDDDEGDMGIVVAGGHVSGSGGGEAGFSRGLWRGWGVLGALFGHALEHFAFVLLDNVAFGKALVQGPSEGGNDDQQIESDGERDPFAILATHVGIA